MPDALKGRHVVLTAGPTLEPIDPVRFISNRSSGKQGYAIATALAALGARVTLVSGPTALNDPANVETIRVETALDMLAAVESALPADVFIGVAAVSDWRPASRADKKLKLDKSDFSALPLTENPDILKTISNHPNERPDLVIGFAAETHDIIEHARGKLQRKGCDWIIANDVSGDVMGGDSNQVTLVTANQIDSWPSTSKADVAARIAAQISQTIATLCNEDTPI
jgi:phosphopantothenoylcysteine decarboxylase/phosphopantothenate--cysteine ligase